MNKNAHELKENVVVSQEIKGSICIKKIIVVLFFVTIIIYASVYFYMENKHNEAIDYLNKQEYDKAYKVLEDLGGVKATKKIKESKYFRVKEYLEKEDYVSAIILLDEIKGYEDSWQLIGNIIDKKRIP